MGKGDSKQIHAVLSDFTKGPVDQSRLRVLIGGNSVVSEQMNEVVGRFSEGRDNPADPTRITPVLLAVSQLRWCHWG